ncbi:MAG TPA: nucleotidyltransferase family protein [Candidatus Dormibacteraeota bacterium]|nr:nucleotidyltransferase family protein [Candidatus Dormibacteraeota bacterium]
MPGTSSALETEWSLLRAACSTAGSEARLDRLRSLLGSPIRWKSLSDLAGHHGVQPLLCQALSGVDQVPQDEMVALKQSYQTNLHKALFLSRELIRIVESLSTSGIDVIPYKGLALAETLYGDIALRQSGDIDLLVRAINVPRIKQVVRELGYEPHAPLSPAQERAYLRSGYEYAFDGSAGRNLLEVQWAIQPRFYAVDFDLEGLFRRAVTVTVAGHSMKTPSSEDLFIVLALHAAKHVWGRLIWLSDLARIITLRELNWEWIGVQAREIGIVRVLRVTLALANRVLEMPIPAAAEENLPEDPAACPLVEEIEAFLTSDSTYDVESFSYFKLMLRLRERRSDCVRFLSRLIFTPGPGEWAAIRLPQPLFPLYRLVRLSRLAARLVRG